MRIEPFLKAVNNYFPRTAEIGEYTIFDNTIAVRGHYLTGQYVRIMDSLLNDSVYKIESVATDGSIVITGLENETFNGIIVGLAIPRAFVELAERMDAWVKKNGDRGIQSESVPNYSVTFKDSNFLRQYGDELAPYRKMPANDQKGFLRHIEVI